MTDLRTRIAAAIYTGVMDSCDGYVEGQESNVTVDPTDPGDNIVVDGQISFIDVADAVIAELGLRREGTDPNQVIAHGYPPLYRYVTEWETDDE